MKLNIIQQSRISVIPVCTSNNGVYIRSNLLYTQINPWFGYFFSFTFEGGEWGIYIHYLQKPIDIVPDDLGILDMNKLHHPFFVHSLRLEDEYHKPCLILDLKKITENNNWVKKEKNPRNVMQEFLLNFAQNYKVFPTYSYHWQSSVNLLQRQIHVVIL